MNPIMIFSEINSNKNNRVSCAYQMYALISGPVDTRSKLAPVTWQWHDRFRLNHDCKRCMLMRYKKAQTRQWSMIVQLATQLRYHSVCTHNMKKRYFRPLFVVLKTCHESVLL